MPAKQVWNYAPELVNMNVASKSSPMFLAVAALVGVAAAGITLPPAAPAGAVGDNEEVARR